ncbi:MAG: hypothetical protein WCB27_20570 [Thermoguttaceae bacterium]
MQQYPSRNVLLKIADAAEKWAKTIRNNWLLSDATPEENPFQLTATLHRVQLLPTRRDFPDNLNKKREARPLLDIAAVTGELSRVVKDIEPGDPLDGLPNVGKLRRRYPQEPVTNKTVSGWPYDVSRALEVLKAVNGTIDRAMSPPMKPIGLLEVQRVEWAAGALRNAAVDQAAKPPITTSTKRRSEKRSWTQPELDAAIEAAIAEYSEAIAAAHKGNKGARREVRKLVGRNALAFRLKVKSPKMVGKSPAWQQLADEFGMRRKSGKAAVPRPAKIGLDIAAEMAAGAVGDTTAADVEHRETSAILDAAIANVHRENAEQAGKIRQALADTKEKLIRGEIDDTKAREIVAIVESQQQDDNSRKVSGSL